MALTVPQHSGAAQSGTAATKFVTRSGTKLLLNGKIFRFSGTNIYWGGYDENARPTDTYPTQFRVDAALQTAQDMGETVVRCQTCGISTGSPLSVEPALGDFSQAALAQIDYFVARAAAHQIRLVIPLTDQYNYFLGSYCNFTDWLKLSTTATCPSTAAVTDFYTNPRAIAAFEKYILILVNHVNAYTKVANKNNPTIMAWETGNELPYGTGGAAQYTQWTATISAYLKSVAPSQLVMDGSAPLDPGDLKLGTVDIQDVHPYPIALPKFNAQAKQVAAAGQALVAGEYGWNNTSTTSGLAPFLKDIADTPSVSGDLYWDLMPQNDFFGFVEHYDGFQLHFPGDDFDVGDTENAAAIPVRAATSDAPLVTDLRNHAYAMSGLAVPAYPLPAAPVITNIEHVASTTAGTGNLLEWRGSPIGASYLVSSAPASTGPWTTVGTVSAAATDLPYLASGGGPGPNLWYTVTAINANGKAGVPSTPHQVKGLTLDDNLSDFTLTASHLGGVSIDTSTPALYFGDASRANYPAGPTAKTIAWHAAGVQDLEAIAYYANSSTGHFSFQVSANGTSWSGVPAPDIQQEQIAGTTSSDRLCYIYTIDNVQKVLGGAGANYIRIERGAGATGVAELGEVRITYP